MRGPPDRGPPDRGPPDRGPGGWDRGPPDRGPPDRGPLDRGPPGPGWDRGPPGPGPGPGPGPRSPRGMGRPANAPPIPGPGGRFDRGPPPTGRFGDDPRGRFGDRRSRSPPRRPDAPRSRSRSPPRRDGWDQRGPQRPPRPDMPPRKRDRGERDKDGSSPRSASSPREKRPRSGWDAAPKPSDSSEKSSGALPPRPAGPAPAHIKKAAAKAAAAIKSQSSPVQALELQLPRGSDDRSAAPSMSPRTPSASPTSSPAAASTPGSGALAKIGVLNQIKQVEVELAVKKKEMDGLKKEWRNKQEDFEERRQEHDDAEEQRLQAEEEKLRREQEEQEGKRRREEDGEPSDEEDELALDEDVEDADGTLGITKRITKENMAKSKKAARLSGRINKLWHADMKKNNVSAKGRPLYETPESAPLYQKVAAQHVARWDGVVAIVRSRKAAENAHGRKLGKQWAKLKKKWEAKPKKLKGPGKTPRGGGGGGGASWDDGPPLTPCAPPGDPSLALWLQSTLSLACKLQRAIVARGLRGVDCAQADDVIARAVGGGVPIDHRHARARTGRQDLPRP